MVNPMRSAQLKDNLRQIRFTLNRYLAILLITALGVAFFAGLRATGPDMRATAESYLNGQNFMDVRVVSTMGFDENDLDAIGSTPGIAAMEVGYSADVLALAAEDSWTIRLHSLAGDDRLNRPELVQGRLPQGGGECLADPRLLDAMGFKVGDTIHLASGTDAALSDTVSRDSYVIVGAARSPLYISHDRGASAVGSGRVGGYLYIPEQDFTMEVFTEVALSMEGVSGLSRFDDAYLDALQPTKDALEAAGERRADLRLGDIRREAQAELDDASRELEDGKQKLADGQRELEDARADLDQGWKDYRDGQKEFEDEIADAQRQLDDGQKAYDKGLSQYNAGMRQYKQAKADSDRKLADAQSQLDAAQAQWQAGQTAYEQGKATSDSLNAALAAGPTPEAVATVAAIAQALQSTAPELSAALSAYVANPTDPVAVAAAQGAVQAFAAQLAQTKAQLDEAAAQLQAQSQALAQGRAQAEAEFAAAARKLSSSKAKLNTAKKELLDNREKLAQARVDGQKELDDALEKLQDGETEYAGGLREYNDELPDAQRKIADGERDLADGEKKLAQLKKPVWYVLDEDANAGFVSLRQDAERMDAIGSLIPLLFFLVVVLVTMTSMTRLVESDRGVIGTYKALGYSNFAIARRYLLYAVSASLLGGVGGLLAGINVFPRVIFNAYSYLYAIPNLHIGYYPSTAMLSLATAVLSTAVPAFLVCLSSLHSAPAELIRPQAPHGGRRIALERFTPLWKRLNFSQKVSMRNLFRYKKRLVMTVLGVAFCTSLMFTGFGLRDAIQSIGAKQFEEISVYDMQVTLKSDAQSADLQAALAAVAAEGQVTESAALQQEMMDVSANGVTKTVVRVVPLDEGFARVIHLRQRVGHKPLTLGDDGAVVTEKLTQLLKLKVGDTLTLHDGERQMPLRVSGIAENYLNHTVYLSPALYRSLYGSEPEVNELLCHLQPGSADEMARRLLEQKAVSAVNFTSTSREAIDKVINALRYVVMVLIASAALLLFVVLFSLNTINLEERRRELATIKVLGFYDGELAAYLYRENIVLTVLGILLGLVIGVLEQRYVILTVEVDFIMFGRDVLLSSYLYSMGLTAAFAAIVNLGMLRSFRKIDMVSSLKSVE